MAKISFDIPNGYECKGCEFFEKSCSSQRDGYPAKCKLYDIKLAYNFPKHGYENAYKLPMCMQKVIQEKSDGAK